MQSAQLVIRRVKFGVKYLILIIIIADYTQFGILNDTSWEIKLSFHRAFIKVHYAHAGILTTFVDTPIIVHMRAHLVIFWYLC